MHNRGDEDMEIFIYSRNDVEDLIKHNFPDNAAVVSFYDPAYGMERPSLLDYQGKPKALITIPLEDIRFDELEEYGFIYEEFFPEAKEVAEFIEKAYKKKMDILCQCEYGQGRSAGCAAAIMEAFFKRGIEIFADYRYCPNQMVYNKLYEELKQLQ